MPRLSMLPISFARRVTAPRCLCSASPFNAFAYARQCSSVACRINALASLCTCFFAPRFSAPSHVLWPLIPRSAGHTPAIPTPFFAPPSPVDAVLFRCNFSLCRAFPSQSTALPLLIAAVPLHIGASPLQIWALRSFAIARLLDAHRCNSSAILVTAMPMPMRRSS